MFSLLLLPTLAFATRAWPASVPMPADGSKLYCEKCHDLFNDYQDRAFALDASDTQSLQDMHHDMLFKIESECDAADVECDKTLHTLGSYHPASVVGFLKGESWLGQVNASDFCVHYIEACHISSADSYAISSWLHSISKTAVRLESQLAQRTHTKWVPRQDNPCSVVCDDKDDSDDCFQCCTSVQHSKDWGCDNALTAPSCCSQEKWSTSACYEESGTQNNQHPCSLSVAPVGPPARRGLVQFAGDPCWEDPNGFESCCSGYGDITCEIDSYYCSFNAGLAMCEYNGNVPPATSGPIASAAPASASTYGSVTALISVLATVAISQF